MRTRRFIIISTLLTVLLAAPFTLAGLLLPPQYQGTYLGAFQEKCRLLENTPGKRIIVAGGSGAAFAIDSALLERNFPGYSAVNLGMYGDLGIKVPLDIARSCLHEGDIVIIAPEQHAQTLSLRVGGRSALQCLDGAWSLLLRMDSADYGALMAYLPEFSLEKWRYALSGGRSEGEGVYKRDSFNHYGDIETDIAAANTMPNLYDPTVEISYDPAQIEQSFVDYLNRFASSAKRSGAEVCYYFCPADRLAVTGEYAPDDFYNALSEALTFPILGDPNHSVMDAGWFFDTNFHLNQSGRTVYTRQLIRDLKAWKGIAARTDIALPPLRSPAPDWNGFTVTREMWAGNAEITEVELPENTIVIEDYAFDGCGALKYIHLRNPQPSSVIVGNHLLDGTAAALIVPRGTLSAYRTDYRFSRYADRIEEEKLSPSD